MMRCFYILLMLAAAFPASGNTAPRIAPYGFYPLTYTTLEERKRLQDESLIHVIPTWFMRVNPAPFDLKIDEDEKLIDVINKVLPVITKESILPEHIIMVLVKTDSVHQIVISTRRTLESQIDKIDLPVVPGDILLMKPR